VEEHVNDHIARELAQLCQRIAGGSTGRAIADRGRVSAASGGDLVFAPGEDWLAEVTPERYAAIPLADAGEGGERAAASAPAWAAMHASALQLCAARFVAHTQPPAANAILCSRQAYRIVEGQLQCDEDAREDRRVEALLMPYAASPEPFAEQLRARMCAYRDLHGAAPTLLYLQNRGVVAVGETAAAVVHATALAEERAQILLATMSLGGPHYVGPGATARNSPPRPPRPWLVASRAGPRRG
jgi:ribulose-5-phosphate 4-epimerase/fuculose-1-phosphate aldolase